MFKSWLSWLFGRKSWKNSPKLLGGATARPWTKSVNLAERGAFDRARFGKYDRVGKGRLIFRWAIILPVFVAFAWFIWESNKGLHLFR